MEIKVTNDLVKNPYCRNQFKLTLTTSYRGYKTETRTPYYKDSKVDSLLENLLLLEKMKVWVVDGKDCGHSTYSGIKGFKGSITSKAFDEDEYGTYPTLLDYNLVHYDNDGVGYETNIELTEEEKYYLDVIKLIRSTNTDWVEE